MNEKKRKVEAFFEAFSNGDVDALLKTLNVDCVYSPAAFKQIYRGKKQAKEVLSMMFNKWKGESVVTILNWEEQREDGTLGCKWKLEVPNEEVKESWFYVVFDNVGDITSIRQE